MFVGEPNKPAHGSYIHIHMYNDPHDLRTFISAVYARVERGRPRRTNSAKVSSAACTSARSAWRLRRMEKGTRSGFSPSFSMRERTAWVGCRRGWMGGWVVVMGSVFVSHYSHDNNRSEDHTHSHDTE